ncbi:hypothetical protein [Streptomyces sp. NPDC047043]|uniref:hypothetical protein n=1 Tax=Streptomyces sp. NPDC047043 TaxID=3154497 RepID=UPI003403DBDB
MLSLEASFDGKAPDGTLPTGTDYVYTGVATGSATTEGSVAARAEGPDTVAIHPDVDGAQVTPADSTLVDTANSASDAAADTSSDASSGGSANTWQSVDGGSTTGFSPDTVNGVDCSAVKRRRGEPVDHRKEAVPGSHRIPERRPPDHLHRRKDQALLIHHSGEYDIPSGGAVARYGADVSSKDGPIAHRNSSRLIERSREEAVRDHHLRNSKISGNPGVIYSHYAGRPYTIKPTRP